MGFTAIVARGLRWSNLLEPLGYNPKKWNNIHAVSLSYFVSLAIPRSGELVRCTAINQVEDIPVDKLFGTVLLERVIDTLILLLFVGFAFLLNFEVFTTAIESAKAEAALTAVEEPTFLAKNWIWILLLVLGIVLFVLRKKILSSEVKTKIKNFLDGMKEGLLSIKKLDKKGEFIGYSILIWGMYYLSMVVMLKAMNMSPFSWNEALFLVVAGGLGVVIPTNNGIGTYHLLVKWGVFSLASAYAFWPDLSKEDILETGLSLAWLQWGTQTLMMVIAGLVATVSFALQRKNLNVNNKK